MPAVPTGSRPVALTPVPAHKFGPRSHSGSCQANRDPVVHASTHAQASSPGDGVAGLASTSPTPTPTPNPHSVRGTAGCLPTAISCLGAFRTPASRAWRVHDLCLPASENLHRCIRSAELKGRDGGMTSCVIAACDAHGFGEHPIPGPRAFRYSIALGRDQRVGVNAFGCSRSPASLLTEASEGRAEPKTSTTTMAHHITNQPISAVAKPIASKMSNSSGVGMASEQA